MSIMTEHAKVTTSHWMESRAHSAGLWLGFWGFLGLMASYVAQGIVQIGR